MRKFRYEGSPKVGFTFKLGEYINERRILLTIFRTDRVPPKEGVAIINK